MVAYSFKKQFAEPIRAGSKRQTIRAERHRHAREGENLQLYTGMRTKACHLIGRARCISTLPVELDFRHDVALVGSLEIAGGNELDNFARRDGFADWAGMKQFWAQEHDDPDRWSGVIIFWDQFEAAPQ